jgi:ABC-type phosphate/phosphonate transport system substrate-binding protein
MRAPTHAFAYIRQGVASLAVMVATLFGPGRAAADDTVPGRIVYFDPDANHQAIVNIATWFTDYLASASVELVFQAVESRDAFERLLTDPKTRYALVSSTYLAGSDAKLEPILVPQVGGDPFYYKVLIDVGIGDGHDMSGKNLAATVIAKAGSTNFKELLSSLSAGGVRVEGTHVIPVAKDIDALLALSFGQVQAALVTPDSVEVLKRINPGVAAKFRIVYRSSPILRATMCEVGKKSTPKERGSLVSALQRMSQSDDGRKAMRTMGFEGWIAFQPEMLKR